MLYGSPNMKGSAAASEFAECEAVARILSLSKNKSCCHLRMMLTTSLSFESQFPQLQWHPFMTLHSFLFMLASLYCVKEKFSLTCEVNVISLE